MTPDTQELVKRLRAYSEATDVVLVCEEAADALEALTLALQHERERCARKPIVTFDEDGGMHLNWTDLLIVEIDAEGMGYAIFRDGEYHDGSHDAQKNWKAATDEIASAIRSNDPGKTG